jgi:hypothetical protein
VIVCEPWLPLHNTDAIFSYCHHARTHTAPYIQTGRRAPTSTHIHKTHTASGIPSHRAHNLTCDPTVGDSAAPLARDTALDTRGRALDRPPGAVQPQAAVASAALRAADIEVVGALVALLPVAARASDDRGNGSTPVRLNASLFTAEYAARQVLQRPRVRNHKIESLLAQHRL